MTKIIENDKQVASETKTKLVDVLIDAARSGLKVIGESISKIHVAEKSTEKAKEENADSGK